MCKMIVAEFPEEFKAVMDAALGVVELAKKRIETSHGGRAVDFVAVEEEIRDAARRVEQAAIEPVLLALRQTSERIEVRGKVYFRLEPSRATYFSQAGPISFDRSLYRQVGVRNGPTIDPIGLRVGVVGDGWLPGSAKAMARLLAQGTSREAESTARELGRLPYSRTSFERIPHLVGEVLTPHRADIENELIHEFVMPEGAASVSVSADCVSVPMEEPAKRCVGRPRKNAPKNPISREFRMAWCGALTIHDELGDAIHTVRYGRMPGGDEVGLFEGLASDAKALLEKRPSLAVVKLADGAAGLWSLLDEHISSEWLGKETTRLVDFWHFIEKLSAAAKLFDPTDFAGRTQRWRQGLLTKKNYVFRILGELRDSNCEDRRVGEQRPVHEAITYIENNHDRMRYAEALEANLPIGSGAIEATCKSLFAVRMKRSGSRWKAATGEHVVQLRALCLSDRWDAAMNKLFARHRTAVRSAA